MPLLPGFHTHLKFVYKHFLLSSFTMNKLSLTLTAAATVFAVSSCSNPYEAWQLPTVVKKNSPRVQQTPSRHTQMQPEFEAPKPAVKKPAPSEQKQPEFVAPKPEVKKPAPAEQRQPEFTAPKPEVKKPAPAEQKQPEFTAPKPEVKKPTPPKQQEQKQPSFNAPQQVKVNRYSPRPVMTQQEKTDYAVMPGQNRGLKRRR